MPFGILATEVPELTGRLPADADVRARAWAAVRAALDDRRGTDGVWLGSATRLITARR